MPQTPNNHKLDNVDKAFRISLILKGLDGVLELIGGLLLALVSQETINNIVKSLTTNDLSENKHDFISNHLLAYSHHLSKSSITFGSIYLLLHGIVKIVLVASLLKEKIWAYPWMLGFLGIFVVYQIYRMVIHFSLGLFLLTIFDIFIIYLTIIEYKRHKKRHVLAD